MSELPAVLLLKQEFPPPLEGGARIFYHELLRRQTRLRFTVLTGSVGPEDAGFDSRQPYAVERRVFLSREAVRGYASTIVQQLRWLRESASLARETDLVVLGQMGWISAVAPVLRSSRGTPYVVFLHGEELTRAGCKRGAQGRLQRAVYRRAFRGASAVIVNSTFTRDVALRFGVESELLTVVSPGVDAGRFRPERERLHPADPPRLLTVGRLFERKGLDVALRAFSLVSERHPRALYEIVGEGPERRRLEEIARNLGVEHRVRFHGRVAEEALPAFYRRADLFLLPNRELPNADTEGFGMVFLEAAAAGVPVVAGRAGGTADAILDGETGLRVDGESPEEVASAVRRLLEEPETWRRMSRAGRERSEREFSWAGAAGRFSEALIQAIHSSR